MSAPKKEHKESTIKQIKKAASKQIITKAANTPNKKASVSKEIWKDLLASKDTKKLIQNTWSAKDPKNNKTDVRAIIKQLSQEAKKNKNK